MNNVFVLMFASACGSSWSEFDSNELKGTWMESDFQFTSDDCELSSVIPTDDQYSYTFTRTFSANNSYESPELQSTNIPTIDTLLESCFFEDISTPKFRCELPWLLVHYDSWKEAWSNHAIAESQDCTIQFQGYSDGLFIDEQDIVLVGYLNAYCNTENGEEATVECSSSFRSTLIKQ